MRTTYVCEKCGNTYLLPEDALHCETKHRDIENVVISGIKFGTGFYDSHVPVSLRLKFSESMGDYGVYRLEHYGPKGV